MKFDQKFFPFEAEFSDLGPGESFNFCVILKNVDTTVHHRQTEGHTVLILKYI